MPTFHYIAVDRAGRRVTGEMVEPDEGAVVARLRQEGHFPAQVRTAQAAEQRAPAGPPSRGWLRHVSGQEMAILSRQLATLVRGGLPIVAAFSALLEHTENGHLRSILAKVRADVEGGSTLGEALAAHPHTFSGLFISMVRAGEASGALPAVLEWLADLQETEQTRRTQVRAALAYPKLLLVVGVSAVLFLMVFLIPRFQELFAEMEQALPAPTLALIAVSRLIASHGWLAVLAAVLAWTGLRRYGRTPGGHYRVDRLKLQVPLFGRLWRKTSVARMARTLGTLTQGGVPILEALGVARGVLENEALARGVDEARRQVREGERLAEALGRTQLFPPLLTQMIGVGEETGDLAGALGTVARTFEVEVDGQMKGLLALLEPAIILGMGVAVAFIILAMVWPLFQINTLAGG